MSAALRLLFVADPSVAAEALAGVRQGGAVCARLVPTANALQEMLLTPEAGAEWEAVVVVPGGPVADVEVAAYVPDGMPIFVVGDEVPLLLTETAAQAVPLARLGELHEIVLSESDRGRPPPGQSLPRTRSGEGPGVVDQSSALPAPLATCLQHNEDEPPCPGDAPLPSSPRWGEEAPISDGAAAGRSPARTMASDAASVADHLPIGLYRSDEAGQILYANPALARVLGCASVEALAEIDVRTDLGYPRDAFAEEVRRVGVVRNLIVTWTTPEGRTVHTRESARAVTDADGRLLYYEGTMEDVTAEVEAQRDLAAAREQAEEMNRLKSAFLANMSHEIRTPLTGILGYAELLGGELEGEHREFVALIESNGIRLLDTLNDVLDLSRLEAGELRPSLGAVDVAREVVVAARRYVAEARDKGIPFEIDVAPGLHAHACPSGFRKVVSHLVGNAVKFTDAGYVRVSAEAEGDEVVLRVADTGVGISEAFVPHLFDAFRQEDTGLARSHEGSGLGLTLTRRLVELMGGRIEVASRRPGGSVSTIAVARAERPPDSENAPASARAEADALAPLAPLGGVGDGLAVHPDEISLGLPPLPADTPPTSTHRAPVARASSFDGGSADLADWKRPRPSPLALLPPPRPPEDTPD